MIVKLLIMAFVMPAIILLIYATVLSPSGIKTSSVLIIGTLIASVWAFVQIKHRDGNVVAFFGAVIMAFTVANLSLFLIVNTLGS